MSEPDKIEELAAKIRENYACSYVKRALLRLMPQTGRFEREIIFESALSFIKNNKEASLQDRIRHIVQYRHDPDAVPHLAEALLEWYDSQKKEDQNQPGPARVAKPAPAAPVIRGEGGMAQDSDDDVVVDMPAVAVIHPPKPGENIGDDDVVFVGTMDERSAAVVSAQEHAKLAALVPSEAEKAEYARRKNEVDVRNIEAQAREFERIRVAREAEAQAREADAQAREAMRLEHSRQRLVRSRNAVARAADAARLKEAVRDREKIEYDLKRQTFYAAQNEFVKAREALDRANKMFEDDERAYQDLNERAAKRPRGGA
jgi:hypothetical protein